MKTGVRCNACFSIMDKTQKRCPTCGAIQMRPKYSPALEIAMAAERINREELDEEYENEPKRGKVSKPSKPQGSLTNHLRSVRSNRDGAHKRSKRLNKEK